MITMSQISQSTQKLIQLYQFWYQSLQSKEGVSTVHVDEVALRVASFYEKIRQIVDWKEEHLMKRAAIIRKLKRRFLDWELNGLSVENKIAEPLVLELIRGGHFPNDKIEESKIAEVQKIINKYIFIFKNSPAARSPREKLQFYNWILEIAACEIEEILAPFRREKALINYMFELMKERIRLKEGIFVIRGMKDEEKDIQIYIAVQQSLFKLDSPIISYHLINYKYPQWKNPTEEFLAEITRNIYNIWANIEKDLSHPLGKKIYAICERYDTPYLLLGDILSQENPTEVAKKITNPEILEGLIRKAYQKRFSTLKKRLSRAAFYYTLSVLLTNSVSVVILEIPVANLIYGFFSRNPLLTIPVDILAPTFLMFLFVATIRLPLETNLNFVIVETMKIVYQKEKVDTYEIKIPQKRGFITKFIITLFYLLGAFISFGFVVWIFQLVKFPATSIIINLIFIALIVFGGLIIRERSKELTVEQRPVGLFGFLFDILFLPVAGCGRWLSNKWKRYNAIAAFFNALIDMPFSIFVEFIENWRFFLKEKKEEIH